MRLQVALELVVALLLSLQLGCASVAAADEWIVTDLGVCRNTGATVVDESTNDVYTIFVCASGAIIFQPYNECRDNPDANCKEA